MHVIANVALAINCSSIGDAAEALSRSRKSYLRKIGQSLDFSFRLFDVRIGDVDCFWNGET